MEEAYLTEDKSTVRPSSNDETESNPRPSSEKIANESPAKQKEDNSSLSPHSLGEAPPAGISKKNFGCLEEKPSEKDTEESNEILDEGQEASSSKDDFFYSDDMKKSDKIATDAEKLFASYSNANTLPYTDSAPAKETYIYYNKEESSSNEEDVIESRETSHLGKMLEKKEKVPAFDEDPKKIKKTMERPDVSRQILREKLNDEYLALQKMRLDMREKGRKYNNKPLIWKYKIESYNSEDEILNEKMVLGKFRYNIEKKHTLPFQSYSSMLHHFRYYGKRKKPLKQFELMQIKNKIKKNRVLEIQKILRKRAKDEKNMLNTARNLHVMLKETGLQSEKYEIFTVLAQQYIFQKKNVVHSTENIINTLASIQKNIIENVRYLDQCFSFITEKIIIE